jgi:hypothetical protein
MFATSCLAAGPEIFMMAKPVSAASSTPSTIFGANLEYWFRGDQTACGAGAGTCPGNNGNCTDGAIVNQLCDYSGNRHTASKAAGGIQPTYVASALNGKPGANLTGGTCVYGISSPFTPTNISGFAVVSVPNLSSYLGIHGSCTYTSGSAEWRIDQTSGDMHIIKEAVADVGSSSSGITSGTYHKIAYTYNSSTGSLSFYIDSDSVVNTTTNVQSFSSALNGIFGANASGDYFNGTIMELVVTNSTATSGQVTSMMGSSGYFKSRYGL